MFQESKVHIIEIVGSNNDINNSLLKVYAIVQIPTINETIIINFDYYFSPSFQGLNDYDIFPNYDTAYQFIKSTNQAYNIKFNEHTSKAIAGYIYIANEFRIQETSLLLIDKAEPIKFQNQEIIYKAQSFTKIKFKKNKIEYIPQKNYHDDFFYSFSSDILSFREKKNNTNYNYFHMNQKPFRRLKINVCPFIINGFVAQMPILNSEVLFICRRSRYSNEISSGMNENGITRGQTEIEMVIAQPNIIGKELSFITVTFGDLPFKYKIRSDRGQTLYEIDKNKSFIKSPLLFFNLLGNRKDKMNNDIFLIDASQQTQQQNPSQEIDISVAMRQTVSFLSGVFHINHIPIDINTKINEKEIIDHIYTLLPDIKMRKQLIHDDNVHYLNDGNQVFYICSNYGNQNAVFISIVLLSKAFKSFFPKLENPSSFIFSLIQSFLEKIVGLNKTKLLSLIEMLETKPSKANAIDNFQPPFNMERCVSLFPTSTIIWPKNINDNILSSIHTRILYQTPDDPIIINLTEVCRISHILFYPVNDKKGNIYKVSPSMVSIYGGLYLNQMFPIAENIALYPTVETLVKIDLNEYNLYSSDLKYSKYGKVRFVSFKFQSLFEKFYISNIFVFTDGSEVLKFPKNIKDESFLTITTNSDNKCINTEVQRIKDQMSINSFVMANKDKIQDIIDVDLKFKNRKDYDFTFTSINKNLIKNELIMIYNQYPFLLNKFKLKPNFMKYYSPNSIHIPYLVASGPQLFEYVNSQQTDLEDFKFFKPKESIIILKLVFLQSYSIDSIDVRCSSPLSIEVLNSDFNYRNIFLPPGGEESFRYNGRVIDIKLKGNPINISFLGFKSESKKMLSKVSVALESSQANEISNDDKEIIKCQEKKIDVFDSNFNKIGKYKNIIGIRLSGKDYYPRYFLFDDQAFFVKMNMNSTFLFPEIINSNSIKVFFKDTPKNKRIIMSAILITLQKDEKDKDVQKKLGHYPSLIQINAQE